MTRSRGHGKSKSEPAKLHALKMFVTMKLFRACPRSRPLWLP